MAESVADRVDDPSAAGVDRYVGLEHLDPRSLRISRWGRPSDVAATKLRFAAGDIIFGKRRAYQRKVARADFEGICSAHALVLRARPQGVEPAFLPYLLASEAFMQRAVRISVGSLSPTINWKTLAKQTFAIPSREMQRTAARLLQAIDEAIWSREDALTALTTAQRAFIESAISAPAFSSTETLLDDLIEDGRPICYGILKPGQNVPDGVPVVKVKDFPQGHVIIDDLLHTAPAIDAAYARSRLRKGDLLLSIRGTVGRLAEVPNELDGANITQDTARLSLRQGVNRHYVRALLESSRVQAQMRVATVGLAVQGINIRDVRRLHLPMPEDVHQQQLLSGLSHFDETARSLSGEVERLGIMKDAAYWEILPELAHA
jgi:type I restriction enzyme, S subunit